MKVQPAALLIAALLASVGAHSQTPAGFRWLDFKREASTVSKVEQALTGEDYTAIREVGIADSFALVMTIKRDSDQNLFYGDAWRVYNVSTRTGNIQTLLVGYNLQIKDWIKFQTQASQDLGVVYMDCWECEPASLFTALHYDPYKGWRARWVNEKDANHPGITMLVTDVGDPYTNEDVDQVFAVLAPHGGVATVGAWYHSRDLSNGKISETAMKFWVDQSTGGDKSLELTGTKAESWERLLCKPASSPYGLSQGQSSRSCKAIVSTKGKGSS